MQFLEYFFFFLQKSIYKRQINAYCTKTKGLNRTGEAPKRYKTKCSNESLSHKQLLNQIDYEFNDCN